MSLLEPLSLAAGQRPDRIAVRTARESVSYAALLERTDVLRRLFADSGVGPGHAVVSILPNDCDFLVTLLACSAIGAAFTPLDPSLTPEELERSLAGLGGRFHCVTRPELVPRLACVSPTSLLLLEHGAIAEDRLTTGAAATPELEGVAMVQLTSGSTGEPKGILLSTAALLARVEQVARALELGPGDRTLCALPLSHSHGVDCLALPSLLTGGELSLLPPAAAAPTTVLSLIERRGVTFFSTVPGFYDLAVRLLHGRNYDLSALRLPFCGSAALPRATAEAFRDRFGVHLIQGYGLAEIGPVSLDLDAATHGEFGSIGTPIAGVHHRVEASGELVVSSASLAHGYLGRPELWAEVVRDGELYTGDLVREGADGRLFLEGRRSRLINVDGQKVHPSEIEELLLELEWVREAVAVGELDDAGIERVAIHVALLPGVQVPRPTGGSDSGGAHQVAAEALRSHLRKRLSSYKWPRRIVFHERLPRSPLGKLLPSKLGAGERTGTQLQ